MIPPEIIAEMSQHFQGEALEEKLAQMQELMDPARRKQVQEVLRKVLLQALHSQCEMQLLSGTRVHPCEVTQVLMDILCSHICFTRDRRLKMQVIAQQMATAFVNTLVGWFRRVQKDEAQTQPGG